MYQRVVTPIRLLREVNYTNTSSQIASLKIFECQDLPYPLLMMQLKFTITNRLMSIGLSFSSENVQTLFS